MSYNDMAMIWQVLTVNNDQKLKATTFNFEPMDKAFIGAGIDLKIEGDMKNGIEGDYKVDTTAKVKIGEKEVEITSGGFEVKVDMKKLEELKMGIGTLPTLADMLDIKGMFAKKESSASSKMKNADAGEAHGSITPLYETRMVFIDQSQYLGSDYFFDQVGYKADTPVTVIGDNYFIDELIRRQLNTSVGGFFTVRDGVQGEDLIAMLMNNAAALFNQPVVEDVAEAGTISQQTDQDTAFSRANDATGTMLAGVTRKSVDNVTDDSFEPGGYAAANAESAGTMLAGVTLDASKTAADNAPKAIATNPLGLEVGKALTAEQMAKLDKDIVWFVNEPIDGQDVLVPRIYLASTSISQMKNGEYAGSAVVYAGGDMNINANSFTNNSGSVVAGGNINIKSQGDIANISAGINGGIRAGGNLVLDSATGSVINHGAELVAGKDMSMNAAQGKIDMRGSVGFDETGKQVIHANTDGIVAGGNIAMNAKSITLQAADIAANGNVALVATDGNIETKSMYVVDSDFTQDAVHKNAFNHRTTDTTTSSAMAATTSITAGGHLSMDASKDVITEGGEYNGKTGAITAGGDVIQKTSQDYAYSEVVTKEMKFELGAKVDLIGKEASATSSDLNGSASYIGTNEFDTDGANRSNASSGKKAGRANISDMAGFSIGVSTLEEKETHQTTTNTNGQFNFTDGLDIKAGNTADFGGADMTSNGQINITANEVKTTKYEDEDKSTYSKTETFVGVKGEAHSSLVDIAEKAIALKNDSDEGKTTDVGMTALQAAGDVSNLVFNDLIGASVTAGVETSHISQEATRTVENINHINAGSFSVKAAGDIDMKGVEITADKGNLEAGGNIKISAAESTVSEHTAEESFHMGITAGASADIKGGGAGASVDVGGSSGSSQLDGISYGNSTLNFGEFAATSGKDTTLAGAVITADTSNVTTGGNLNIQTVQNTSDYDADRVNWGFSLGLAITSKGGLIPTASVSAGGGGEFNDTRMSDGQSGITTKGENNVTVAGDVNLNGGHIVSDTHTGTVDVAGSINATTLHDTEEQDGVYGGGGGGISITGSVTVSMYVDTVEEKHKQIDQKATIDVGQLNGTVTGELNKDGSAMSEAIKDETKSANHISATAGVNPFSKKPSTELPEGGTEGTYRRLTDNDIDGPRRAADTDADGPHRPADTDIDGPRRTADGPDGHIAGDGTHSPDGETPRMNGNVPSPSAEHVPHTSVDDGPATHRANSTEVPVTAPDTSRHPDRRPETAGGADNRGSMPANSVVDITRPVIDTASSADVPGNGKSFGPAADLVPPAAPPAPVVPKKWDKVQTSTGYIGSAGSSQALPGMAKPSFNTNIGKDAGGVKDVPVLRKPVDVKAPDFRNTTRFSDPGWSTDFMRQSGTDGLNTKK